MEKQKTIWSIVGVILLVLIIVLAISKSQTNSNVIRVGAVFSLTGNGAAYGEPARDGLILAVDKINKQGGINGKMVQAVYEDSQFDPKIGLNAYQSLSARGIHYVLTNGSAVSLAVRKAAIDNHDLQFETGAVSPSYSDGSSNTCRITLTAPVSGKKLGEFISQKLKAKTFATLTLNDDFGTSMAKAVSETAAANGVLTKGSDSFDKNATDFRTQIVKLAALHPDVLLVIPAAGQAEAIFRQLKEQNWKGTIVSDNFTIINSSIKNVGVVNGIYFVNYDWSGQATSTDSQDIKDFKDAFIATYHTEPPVIAANVYDSMMVLAKGLAAVGADNPTAVGQWLTGNIKDYQGVTGPITLNQDCESARLADIQQVQDGNYVTVWK